MKNFIIIIMLSMCFQVSAQNQLKVEVGQGLFFTDLLFDEASGIDRFSGWGWLTTGNVYFSKDVGQKFNFDLGVGYSNYYFLDFDGEDYLPYFNSRLVANYRSILNKTDLTLGVTHHILLFDKLEGGIYDRRRSFTNLDLGLVFHPGEKWDLKVTTPITVRAMYKNEIGEWGGPNEIVWTKYWVGTMGLNLGLVYKFSLGKERE